MTTIINNRPNVYSIGAVRLMPGPNDVDDKLAKKFLDHTSAQERIKIGHLTVVESAADAKTAADTNVPAMPKSGGK